MQDSEEIQRIKKDIEKSGLPLEIEASSALREKGWSVYHQGYYLDPDENKPRSIDIAASRLAKTDSTKIDIVNQTLIIECKRSLDKPWVFYTVPSHAENIGDASMYVKFITRPELPPKVRAFLQHSHYLDSKEVAIIPYEPFGGAKLSTAVHQVLKALRYGVKEELDPLFRKLPKNKGIVIILYPVIVFEGRMYKCEKLKDGDLKLSPINYIKYQVSYRGLEQTEGLYLIDIVKKEFLTNYLQLLDDEFKKILDWGF